MPNKPLADAARATRRTKKPTESVGTTPSADAPVAPAPDQAPASPPLPATPQISLQVSTPRPTIFTADLGDRVCEAIAITSRSLATICAAADMPTVGTLLRWRQEIPAFQQQYQLAREARAEVMMEALLEIADDGTNDTQITETGRTVVNQDVIQRSRLRVATRQWLAVRLLLARLGDSEAGDDDTDEFSGDGSPDNPAAGGMTLTRERLAMLQRRRRLAMESAQP